MTGSKREKRGLLWLSLLMLVLFFLIGIRRNTLFQNPPQRETVEETYPYLNEGTINELRRIPGTGKKTARDIVRFRKKKGGITRYEQLVQIDGIGPVLLENIRSHTHLKTSRKPGSPVKNTANDE